MVKLVRSEEEPAETPDSNETPPAKHGAGRRFLKTVLILVFAFIFFGSGWFTYKIAAASNKIFTTNTTGGSPLLSGKKLKGDQQGRINILLLGIGGEGHDGPNLTDTVQVVSIDPKSKQVAMLSIPRDLYVSVPNSFQKVKLNEIHAIGEDQGVKGGGPALDKELISNMLDIPVNYFIRVDFSGFKQLVDAVGGIDVDVDQRLYDPYYPAGESTGYQVLDVEPGHQHMNGDLALKYARSRETSSDFDRSKRQQQVLVAVRDKATQLNFLTNPAKVSQMIDVLGDHIKTDLSIGELRTLAGIVKDIPSSSVNSKVLDDGPTGLLYDSTGPGGAFILLPRSGNYSDIREFAHQLFEGQNITGEHANVEVLNASGRGGLAAQEATILAGYGYNIVNTGNADSNASGSVIYDYSNGSKPFTISALKKRYNAQVIKQNGSPPAGIDVRLIIGSDFSSQNQASNNSGE